MGSAATIFALALGDPLDLSGVVPFTGNVEILATHTGQTAEQVRLDTERDKILTADAAVEYGLIDAILESRKGSVPVA